MNFAKPALVSLGVWIASAAAHAAPAQVVIIRHAEKPATGDEVNARGCERAYALPRFFSTDPTVNRYGRPVAIFAARPDHAGSSLRSVQTIAPTAQALGLAVRDPLTRDEISSMTRELLDGSEYRGRTVLIAWEHDAILDLAVAFGAQLPVEARKWPDDVFDEAWVLDFGHGASDFKHSQAAALTIIPENVLPGDNPQGGLFWRNPPVSAGDAPPELAAKCRDNRALDALTQSLAWPALPAL